MMGLLTTHVLDTANGTPASNMQIELLKLAGEKWSKANTVHTNSNGRSNTPLAEQAGFTAGMWELRFYVADYYSALGLDLPEPAFLDVVSIRFGVADAGEHYHVPLLVSPWSYSTYRGS